MHHPHDHRPLLTAAVLAAGLWTLLASSTFEEGEPDTQARVSFSLSSVVATPLALEDGTFESEISNLRVAGRYEDDLGDLLTLNRNNLIVDVSTSFDFSTDAVDVEDELVADLTFGTVFEVSLDIDEDPTQGQFSVVIDGTTTLLTVDDDREGFTLETGGDEALFRDFEDFRDAVEDDDEDEPDEVRLSAASYAMIPLALQLARITENLADDIELNADTLEGMNLNQALSLTCSNAGGERFLFWRTDAPGTGEGEVGEGDSFELRVESCFDAVINRFVDGTIVLEDYVPIDDDLVERSFGAQIDVATLFISESEVDLGTNASSTAPRISGRLLVSYDEVEIEVEDDEDDDTL